MLELVSAIHLFAGLIWAGGILAIIVMRPQGSDAASVERMVRIMKVGGAFMVLTGILRAFGSATFDERKTFLGLYGLAILSSLLLFTWMISLVRAKAKSITSDDQGPSRSSFIACFGGLAIMVILMTVMSNWP